MTGKNPKKQGRILEAGGKNFSGRPEYIPLRNNELMISYLQLKNIHFGQTISFYYYYTYHIRFVIHHRQPSIRADIGFSSRK